MYEAGKQEGEYTSYHMIYIEGIIRRKEDRKGMEHLQAWKEESMEERKHRREEGRKELYEGMTIERTDGRKEGTN